MITTGVKPLAYVHEIFLFTMRYIIRNLIEAHQVPMVAIAPFTGLHQPCLETEDTTSR